MKKNKNKRFFSSLILGLILVPRAIYTVPAYMPLALRECMVNVQDIAKDNGSVNLQELCAMITENRIFASDRLVRKAAEEALALIDAGSNHAHYIAQYIANMDNKSLLAALHGDDAKSVALPLELVARSCNNNPADMDVIYLSSQFATRENMEVCGLAKIDAVKESEILDALRGTVSFSASSLISQVAPYPNMILGTGTTSPTITAWTMNNSGTIQYPITMQFGVPSDFRRNITIGLHFVVPKQNIPNGKIKIKVEGSFVPNNGQFAANQSSFSATSSSITVNEPTSANEFRHVYVEISLRTSRFSDDSFARFSFTRVAPNNTEYLGDVFLAAAEVVY